MELAKTYTCPCRPGFVYASNQALCQHRKSQRHKMWEGKSKDEKISATQRDNHILALSIKLKDREEQIVKLTNELVNLKVKLNKLTEDNRMLRKGIKKFMNPEPQANLIEL